MPLFTAAVVIFGIHGRKPENEANFFDTCRLEVIYSSENVLSTRLSFLKATHTHTHTHKHSSKCCVYSSTSFEITAGASGAVVVRLPL